VRLSALPAWGLPAVLGSCARLPAPAPAREAAQAVDLVFTFWGNPQLIATFEKDIADFAREAPHITVKPVHIPDAEYYTKLEAMLAGGSVPDLAMMGYPQVPGFAAKGALRGLDAEIKTAGNVEDLYPSVREALKYKGVFYGLPRDVTTFALYYNQELFDQAGLPYPDERWTWTAFLEAAKRLTRTEAAGAVSTYGFHHRPLYDQTMIWVWQNGGNFLNPDHTECLLDRPEATEALQFLADLRTVHRVAPVPNDPALGTEDQGELFLARRIAMYIYGYSGGIKLRGVPGLRYDVAVLPQGRVRANVIYPILYVIPREARHPAQAFQFMKFLAGPVAQKNHAILGTGFPGYKSVAESEVFLKNDIEPKSKKVFLDMIAYARPLDTPPNLADLTRVFFAELAPVWRGERTAKEATAAIKPQVDALLKEMR
jgi:multiple sugar transport system substrate-binding protein